jgi:hypothetical protein
MINTMRKENEDKMKEMFPGIYQPKEEAPKERTDQQATNIINNTSTIT